MNCPIASLAVPDQVPVTPIGTCPPPPGPIGPPPPPSSSHARAATARKTHAARQQKRGGHFTVRSYPRKSPWVSNLFGRRPYSRHLIDTTSRGLQHARAPENMAGFRPSQGELRHRLHDGYELADGRPDESNRHRLALRTVHLRVSRRTVGGISADIPRRRASDQGKVGFGQGRLRARPRALRPGSLASGPRRIDAFPFAGRSRCVRQPSRARLSVASALASSRRAPLCALRFRPLKRLPSVRTSLDEECQYGP